jgi:hypothetical protein
VSLLVWEEKNRRSIDQEEGLKVYADFLEKARAVVGAEYTGREAGVVMRELLGILDGLELSIPKDDLPRQQPLERIRDEIAKIKGRYSVQLPEASRHVEPPRASVAIMVGSALGGAFLGFLFAFARYKLRESYAPSKRH